MSTSLSATLIEFLERIFGGDQEAFLDDPEGYLAEHGLEDLSCADFDDALVSFFENAEFNNGRDGVDLGADFHTEPEGGESDHEAIARHLTQVVHEYGDTYIHQDDRDTYVDNSFQGTVLGDATFDNDTVVASGDGAVAAGGDNENVVTGDGNAIGEGNNVGDGAFGDGAIQGGVTVSDGSSLATTGGTAEGFQDNSSVDDHSTFEENTDASTTLHFEDHSDSSTNDSGNVFDSGNVSDSGNTTLEVELDD